MASSFTWICLLFITLQPADGFLNFELNRCDFNSSELKDIEFIRSLVFNKLEITRFTSSLGRFVGYTEEGVKQADYWNSQKDYITQLKNEKERYCKHNIGNWYSNILSKSVSPYVRIHSQTPDSGARGVLVCSVYDFYPKDIKVVWMRDGQEVTKDVTSTDQMADADWYYQIHSHLEYTPRSGEKISCVVHHISLKEPLITDWDPSLPESERNKIIIGASGLTLGLVLCLAGFIYYKRKAQGRTLVPSS